MQTAIEIISINLLNLIFLICNISNEQIIKGKAKG